MKTETTVTSVSPKEMSETVHTAIALALVSGVAMAVIGVVFARGALEIMGTPDDVIAKSTLYMRIYFAGMPFFMLYNYGAAILRAVGDTKRPLFFLIIAGIVNAALNLFLVIVLHLEVAGVAIATVIAQMISCLLVLRCLYRSDGSYQLRFSAMTIKWIYLKQISGRYSRRHTKYGYQLLKRTSSIFGKLFWFYRNGGLYSCK